MNPRLLVVALLVALAGCSVGSDGETSTTATPAPVPDVNETERAGTPFPPGVENGTVADPAALVAAHERVLSNRSYVWKTSVRTWSARSDGENAVEQTVRAAVVDTSTYRYDRHTERAPGIWANVSVYADGPVEFVRSNTSDGVRYWRRPVDPDSKRTVGDLEQVLATLLDGSETTVEPVRVGGRQRFLLSRGPPPERADAGDVSLRAVIEPSGQVRNVSAAFFVGTGPGRRQVVYEASIDALTGSLEPPAWLSTARERTNESETVTDS